MSSPPKTISWAGRPHRELIRLALPIAISMVSHALMAVVDTLCVSHISAAALAGVGLGSITFFTLAGFGFGFFRGSKTLISQARGAEDKAAIVRHRTAALLASTVVGAVICALVLVAAEFLPAQAASEAAGEAARTYARTVAWAGLPCMLYVALRESSYGVGNSKAPMRAALLANGLNMVLDVFLIWGLDMGVFGAAIATVASFTMQAVFLAFVVERRVARPTREDGRALVRLGTPTGVQYVLEIGGFALVAVLISAMDEREMAAHQIALQLIHFVFLPMMAIAEGSAVMAGQAYGAGRSELLSKVASLSAKVALGYALAWAVVLTTMRFPLARMFTSDQALISTVGPLLIAGAIFQFGDGLTAVSAATLRGIGDVRYTAAVGVLVTWALIPPLTYYLGDTLGYGAFGGWISLILAFYLQAVLLWWRLKRKARTLAAISISRRSAQLVQ